MWIPVVMIALLLVVLLTILGPFLKLLGVVDWEWKIIFASIWVPLAALFIWLLGWALFIGILFGLLAFISN